ncbi:hypothetical protein [Ruegeria sp. HKCCD7318]|uniref:hypothetical protein n=1 Tax=Ruegeria sp. HKCCD7318 TaxID=2683014 RepID=UPI001C11430C|nr:hypothetical protein [Ruegeria sp. HKCCD7318]
MIDEELIRQALHGIASQSILDATIAQRDAKPLDDTQIQARVNETMALIRTEMSETTGPP